MDELHGCKKSLREKRKDDLDDLDDLLSRLLSYAHHGAARVPAGQLPPHQLILQQVEKRPSLVVQVVHPHVKGT
jgi:hypothetical protein